MHKTLPLFALACCFAMPATAGTLVRKKENSFGKPTVATLSIRYTPAGVTEAKARQALHDALNAESIFFNEDAPSCSKSTEAAMGKQCAVMRAIAAHHVPVKDVSVVYSCK